MCTKKVCIFLLLLFFANSLRAQAHSTLNFRNITEKDGLSNKKINSIVQDNNGIIWIGTYNGLNRFDGNRIKTFYTGDTGSRAVPFGDIRSLHVTPERGLWICTPSHLFYMQAGSERFRNMGSFVNAAIYKNGAAYQLIDQTHVYELPTAKQIKENNLPVKKAIKRNPALFAGNTIVADKQQQPWSFHNGKIFRLRIKDLSIQQVYSTPGLQIEMIFFDSQNRCWVASWGQGVFMLDQATGVLTQFNIEQNQFVALGFATWKQEGKSYLVVASDNSMIMVDEGTLQYQKYTDNGRFRFSTAFADKDNNLWLGCEDGIKLASIRQDLFKVIPVVAPPENDRQRWPAGVYSFKETNTGYWLSKRFLSGIFHYDKNWQLKKFWPKLSAGITDFEKTYSSEAFDFAEEKGSTYITTELGIYVVKDFAKERLLAPKTDSNQLPRLRNIERENDSIWWIRSYSNGIYTFDPRYEKFIRLYPVLDKKNQQQPVHYLLRTKKDETFVTTYNGLYQLNAQQTFKKVLLKNAPSEYMLGMAEDKNGIIWVASSNGMFAFDPASSSIVNDFTGYGEMGFCYRVAVDLFNNVWFNCQKGYWCWIQSKQQMLKFAYDMGLPDNRLEAGFTAGPGGTVYAGANDAVVVFNPAAIMQYAVNAQAVITDVVANQSRSYTNVINDSTQQLELPPGKYDLRINFSVPDYATPGNYELYYKIEPGVNTWSLAEKGSVNFSSLEHGRYHVTVKGMNNLTGSYSRPYFLKLYIRPHWYQTVLFKIALCAAITALVFLLLRRRIMRIKTEAQFKQKIAESEMSVLRSQMNPHFIFNSLNSIENFILQNKKRHASDYLIKFSKLIRTILEINQLQLIPFAKDMEALRWYIELEQVRFPEKFSVEIEIDALVEASNFNVPPMIVQPFIENAILHGIAHSKQDGHQLKILVTLQGGFLQYIIEDDGIGMKESATINQLNRPGYISVGLQITKERIRLHNQGEESEIIFMQRQPSGTKVVVKIKIKNNGGTKSNTGR